MRLYIAIMAKIRAIFIYSDHPSKSLSIPEIIKYLKFYGFSSEYRGNLFEFLTIHKEEVLELARRIMGARVLDITSPLDEIREPNYKEIDVELKRIKGEESHLEVRAIHELPLLYDGLWLQRIFYKVLSQKVPDDFKSGFLQVIFTDRLFGTFETKRYHARVFLTGLPTLISTSGIVEAPARPKEYYWLKAGFIQAGKDLAELDQIYTGRFIGYDDPRITSVLAPYLLKAIFYETTGDPFCDNPSCCLYNSHWQEEVLKAQMEQKLCEEHRDMIIRLV